jgi:hypothetical protein
LQGKFSLRNDFAIDRGDILRRGIMKLAAAVKSDEDDDDQSQQEDNNPGTFSFAQDIEHMGKTFRPK